MRKDLKDKYIIPPDDHEYGKDCQNCRYRYAIAEWPICIKCENTPYDLWILARSILEQLYYEEQNPNENQELYDKIFNAFESSL